MENWIIVIGLASLLGSEFVLIRARRIARKRELIEPEDLGVRISRGVTR